MRRPSSSNPNASQLPKRTSLSRTAKIKAGSAIKRDLKRKNENGTVKLETERNNRRRHTKTDETAKSSAASVATNNSSTSCTDASQDLQLERENSAWDTLGERFVCAASDGRCIDLSNDNTITTLSASRAQEEFATKPAPIDPSTIVQPNQATASQQETANDLRLEPLWLYIHYQCYRPNSTRATIDYSSNGVEDMAMKKTQSDTVSMISTMRTCEGFKHLSVRMENW